MHNDSPPSERLSITPLIDIAFLVIIFFMALPLKQLDGKLASHLPTQAGIWETIEEPRSVVPIWVRHDSFMLGDREVSDVRRLMPTMRLLGKENTYSVRAMPAVDWQRIVAVVNVLAELRFPHVEFYGTRSPPRTTRRSVPLPMPVAR
jgi:biopolymer transport protein ExbD